MTLKISRSQVSTQPNPWMDPTHDQLMVSTNPHGTRPLAIEHVRVVCVEQFYPDDITTYSSLSLASYRLQNSSYPIIPSNPHIVSVSIVHAVVLEVLTLANFDPHNCDIAGPILTKVVI